MTDEQDRSTDQAEQRAADEAEQIASEATEVRERVRDTFVKTVGERRVQLNDLADLADQMFQGAISGIEKSTPQDEENVLRQVVDGLSDGLSSAANATRLAFEEARSRGEAFAKEDVDRAIRDLRELEQQFTETIWGAMKRAGRETGEQAKSLFEHTQRTASHMRPILDSAIEAARQHPVEFAGETAKASVKAGAHAAGMLLQSVSGLLQGAGDVLTGAGSEKRSDESSERDDNSPRQ